MENKLSNDSGVKKVLLSVTMEYDEVKYSEEKDIFVMASLKAPEVEDIEKQRAPIDLVAVVDTSGSMGGNKIELVKKTLEFIIKELNQKDRFSIVSFDSNVRVLIPLTNMNQSGKEIASKAAQDLSVRGSTALAPGLLQGLQIMRERKNPNEVASVLLLTDGQANVGMRNTDEIVAAMKDPNARISFSSTSDRRQVNVRRQSIASGMPVPQVVRSNSASNASISSLSLNTPTLVPSNSTGSISSVKNEKEPPKRKGSFLGRLFSKKDSKSDLEKSPSKELVQSKSQEKVVDVKEMPQVKEEPEELPVVKFKESGAVGCVVNTFGYGSDHDANMLRAISDAGEGVYYYIENEEKVAESFADCIGGLVSVVAQNITLSFEAKEGAVIKKVLTKYKTTEVKAGSLYTVNLGDIQSEEQRDILASVVLAPIKEPIDSPKPIVSITLSYFNVISSGLENEIQHAHASRPSKANEKKTPPKEIDLQRNRIMASEALEKANSLASGGRIEEGKKVIKEALETINKAPTAKEEFVTNLVGDLKECMEQMKDSVSYSKGGQQMMNTKMVEHSKQRSANSSSNTSYSTKQKVAMKSKFQS